MSNWVAAEEYEFTYQCNAYYLNVKLDGKHEFKIAEESWRDTEAIAEQNFLRYAALNSMRRLRREWGQVFNGLIKKAVLRMRIATGFPPARE